MEEDGFVALLGCVFYCGFESFFVVGQVAWVVRPEVLFVGEHVEDLRAVWVGSDLAEPGYDFFEGGHV